MLQKLFPPEVIETGLAAPVRCVLQMMSAALCLALGHAQEPATKSPIPEVANAPAAEVKPSALDAFSASLTEAFPKWDADHDATLSLAELDAALADPMVTGDAAATLAVLKRIDRIKSGIPLTLDGIRAAAALPKAKDRPDLPGMFADGRKRIARANRALFASEAPSLQSLHQGPMGNCFSLAPLGAMLHRDPAQVRAMFRENADGTFDVKLGAKMVRVAAPTEAEIALSSSNEASGLWSNVYEKAAGSARNELRPEKERVTTPLDAIARGGSAGTMLAFLTGNPMERFSLKWAKDEKTSPEESATRLRELREKLLAAIAARRCITTGTAKPTLPGLRGNHAFAVIGFSESTDEVRIWDPHGDAFTPKGTPDSTTGFPRKDGVFELPLGVFVKQFTGLAFELPPRG